MSHVARYLQPLLRRAVVDRTGLFGKFDLDLTFATESVPGLLVPSEDPQATDGSALTTAIHEQLGLRLVSARGPVEVLVIDKAEPPTSN